MTTKVNDSYDGQINVSGVFHGLRRLEKSPWPHFFQGFICYTCHLLIFFSRNYLRLQILAEIGDEDEECF